MAGKLIEIDCIEAMKAMEPESIDAVVCDPPYLISFMGKEFDDQDGAASDPVKAQAWHLAWTKEAFRVLKPGGHLLSFGGTRTFHRLACAIEDAGFEIRDSIGILGWCYGSGFPKSASVSKMIDKAAGVEREDKFEGVFERRAGPTGNKRCEKCGKWLVSGTPCTCPRPQDEPVSDEAKKWAGHGTGLKPAWEPIVCARRPLIGTVVENVLKHGTGAINIDGCRVGMDGGGTNCNRRDEKGKCLGHPDRRGTAFGITYHARKDDLNGGAYSGGVRPTSAMGLTGHAGGTSSILEAGGGRLPPEAFKQPEGRWPPNLVLAHHPDCGEDACHPECSVRLLGEQSATLHKRGNTGPVKRERGSWFGAQGSEVDVSVSDEGGTAARFFPCFRYEGKASSSERSLGLDIPRQGGGDRVESRNLHPT